MGGAPTTGGLPGGQAGATQNLGTLPATVGDYMAGAVTQSGGTQNLGQAPTNVADFMKRFGGPMQVRGTQNLGQLPATVGNFMGGTATQPAGTQNLGALAPPAPPQSPGQTQVADFMQRFAAQQGGKPQNQGVLSSAASNFMQRFAGQGGNTNLQVLPSHIAEFLQRWQAGQSGFGTWNR